MLSCFITCYRTDSGLNHTSKHAIYASCARTDSPETVDQRRSAKNTFQITSAIRYLSIILFPFYRICFVYSIILTQPGRSHVITTCASALTFKLMIGPHVYMQKKYSLAIGPEDLSITVCS